MDDVNRAPLSCSLDCSRSARSRLLRVLLLAFALIVANGFAPAAAAGAGGAAVAHAGDAAHHCHDRAPDKHTQHGKGCPHCSAGCFCLHSGAAPLPEFVTIPALIPHALATQRGGSVPPAPALAENLRPPIA